MSKGGGQEEGSREARGFSEKRWDAGVAISRQSEKRIRVRIPSTTWGRAAAGSWQWGSRCGQRQKGCARCLCLPPRRGVAKSASSPRMTSSRSVLGRCYTCLLINSPKFGYPLRNTLKKSFSNHLTPYRFIDPSLGPHPAVIVETIIVFPSSFIPLQSYIQSNVRPR